MSIDISYFKKKLSDEKSLLEKELKTVGAPKPENPTDWDEKEPSEDAGLESADLNLAADRQEEIAERHATVDELEARYQEVVLALARIDDGSYGICTLGKEEIEKDRLDANPAAKTCKKHLNSEE